MSATQTDTLQRLRRAFRAGRTRPLAWRVEQLQGLRRLLTEREDELLQALADDLGKSSAEGFMTEVGFLNAELGHALEHLADWMEPRRVPTPLAHQLGTSTVVAEPLGVALIIGTWNYPVQLLLGPLIGAIAAGCCALLKPSELAPATSAAVARLVPRYLDGASIAVIEGGVGETTALLELRFDHIFFTGGSRVGRIIMAAAAKHLTPVTLELGGKSPAVIDASVDLDVAVRRIIWGKFVNAGQTCIAPDYVLVNDAVHDEVLRRCAETVRQFYGDDPARNPQYGRIIHEGHFDRLMALMESGRCVIGGQADRATRYIAPTVLADVAPDAPIMQEEIFGPLLPVLRVSHTDAALEFILDRPKPLALYLFSDNPAVQERFVQETSSGAICLNDTVSHVAIPELPFGGVGESGMGAYHGHVGFETFSHLKAVFHRSTRVDLPLRYPPYTDASMRWIRRLL